jgi:xanthine dehydrogenase small subunit
MPDYVRARSLHEALDIRAARDVAVIAGGTDIYPAWVSRRAWGDPTHKDILDISGVNKLRGVSQTDTHWQIGALTTWTDIIEAPLPPLFSGLKAAARAGAEPRHNCRKHLHRLSGRGRHTLPAGARRGG